MIALLALVLSARDEVTDLVAKLRAAADLTSRYQITNQIAKAAKAPHVPVLAREIDAGPAGIRPHLIRVLAEIGTKEAVAAMRTFAQKHDIACRAEAAYHLATYEEELGVKTLVLLLSKAESEEDKRTILSHLWGLPSEGGGAAAALAAFLDREKKEDLRKLAVRALAYQRDPSAIPALRKVASNADDSARFEAMSELVRRGDAEALESALQTLETAKVGFVDLYTLLNAIERANSKAALPRLRDLLERTTDRSLRTVLIRTLADLKDEKSLAAIAKLAGDADASVARAATEAVIKLSGKGQLALLQKAAAESQGVARVEASTALLNLDRPEGFEGLKAELESGNAATRISIVLALSKLHRKESVDLLLPLLEAEEMVRNQARGGIFAALDALFPYLRFDRKAAADAVRAWWAKNRPK